MVILRSVTMRNYRRYQGEVELELGDGITVVSMPPGKGKTTVLEAISWCLFGSGGSSNASEIPNAQEMCGGGAEVMIALSFDGGARLERSMSCPAEGGQEVRTERWSLVDRNGRAVQGRADDEDDLMDLQEELFPTACAYSNLVSGPGLLGGPRRIEKAVTSSGEWCCTDLPLRAGAEATSLFFEACPSSMIDLVAYDPMGRPEVRVDPGGEVEAQEVRMALLAHALGFIKAHDREGSCPIFLDEPFHGMGADLKGRALPAVLSFLEGRQVIFLLSDPSEVEALRATGTVDKELEIWG